MLKIIIAILKFFWPKWGKALEAGVQGYQAGAQQEQEAQAAEVQTKYQEVDREVEKAKARIDAAGPDDADAEFDRLRAESGKDHR